MVLLHFGMTGSIVIRGVAAFRYKEFVVHDETWPPKSRNVSSACPRAMGYAEYAREALLGEARSLLKATDMSMVLQFAQP